MRKTGGATTAATRRDGVPAVMLAAAWVAFATGYLLNAQPQTEAPTGPQAVVDQTTYNAGDEVGLRLVFPPASSTRPLNDYAFTVRYAGEEKPQVDGLTLGAMVQRPGSPGGKGYYPLWKLPAEARTGRYEIDMRVRNAANSNGDQNFPCIGSFVVHRQIMRLVSAEATEPFYTSGDTVACSVKLENLSSRTLSGLRLEFSERYWPWIAQQRNKIGTNIEKLQNDIALKPHQQISINAARCALAKKVDKPDTDQYAAVVWDRGRKNVEGIAITPLVFIDPPGIAAPRPYPPQFIYPSLDKVNTTNYRHFQSEPFGADAIQFDTRHTQFPTGAEATVKFSLSNATDNAWLHVRMRSRLLGPDGAEQAKQTVAEGVNMNPHGAKLTQEVKFPLPAAVSGIFHAWVEIVDASNQVMASNELELGVNPLPKSVLIFGAHEDDDGTQMGFIRSLVENQTPLKIIYYTSGDTGSCDKYFQHYCTPADALDFGAIRMQEARAAMGHLGVTPENIIFLGLPDGGLGKIWYNHPNVADPYLAVLLASDHAPYVGLFRPNLPFARDAVIAATEEIIRRHRPGVIFTLHPPAEGHIDHIVNNFFAVKALQELLRTGAVPADVEVRVDRIFDPKEHPATPYQYEDHEFYVSGEAMALAQEAGWFYQSQGGNRVEGDLHTWSQLKRSEGYRKVIDWNEHQGWNEKE